jgi:two-component system LytT family response regulator
LKIELFNENEVVRNLNQRTMLLRAVIIDDEQRGINSLKILLERFSDEIKIVAESTNAFTGIDLIENYAPDVVFLDINMPGMNGFELLERLRWRNFQLIFITAHGEHALKALKSNALDYILKPMGAEDLRFAIDKVKSRIPLSGHSDIWKEYQSLFSKYSVSMPKKIAVNSKSGLEHIDLRDIVHLESKNNHTWINLTGPGVIVTSTTLRDFDRILCTAGSNFMRVHHSYIINLDQVVRYIKQNENIIMTNDVEIPLAKSKRGTFFRWMNI